MIYNNFSEIDDTLKEFLQQDLIIKLNNQSYKKGKLILFNKSYFSINLILKKIKKDKLKTEVLKVPYPFEYYIKNNCLYFDYKLKSFFKNDEDLPILFKGVRKPDFSKFYDKLLEMSVL